MLAAAVSGNRVQIENGGRSLIKDGADLLLGGGKGASPDPPTMPPPTLPPVAPSPSGPPTLPPPRGPPTLPPPSSPPAISMSETSLDGCCTDANGDRHETVRYNKGAGGDFTPCLDVCLVLTNCWGIWHDPLSSYCYLSLEDGTADDTVGTHDTHSPNTSGSGTGPVAGADASCTGWKCVPKLT